LPALTVLTLTGSGEVVVQFEDETRTLQISPLRVLGPYASDSLIDVVAVAQCTAEMADAPQAVATWSDSTGTALRRPDGGTVGVGGISAAVVGSGDTTGATDSAAIAAALITAAAGNKTISFVGDIYFGDKSSAYIAIDLTSLGNDWTFISYGANFHLNTTGASAIENIIFKLQNNDRINFLGSWKFIDAGSNKADPDTAVFDRGLCAFRILDGCQDIHIDTIYTESCRCGISTAAGSSAGSSKRISANSIKAYNTFYVVSLANQGNDSHFPMIEAEQCGRPFFVYGAENCSANVVQTNTYLYGNEIKRYDRDTRNIVLCISDRRTGNASFKLLEDGVITISHANNDGASSIIDNIDIDVTAVITDGSAANSSASLVAFNDQDVNDSDNDPGLHKTTNLRISGTLGPYTQWVCAWAQTYFTLIGSMYLPAGARVTPVVEAAFNILSPRTRQPQHVNQAVTALLPNGGVATYGLIGMAVTETGTATARACGSGHVTKEQRIGFVSSASAGNSAGFFATTKNINPSAIDTSIGGYNFTCIFVVSSASPVANGRAFVGLYATAGVIGNVEPTSLVNMIGIGWDAGDATMRIMHNDGSGTATEVDLGANFPTTTVSQDIITFNLFHPCGGAYPRYTVRNLQTGVTTQGMITSANQPAQGTMLGPQVWINNGATAAAVGIDIALLQIETIRSNVFGWPPY
jgi:hypothetical protein